MRLLLYATIGIIFASAVQLFWSPKITMVFIRKAMIYILPYWDWTRLYHSDCILTNPFYNSKYLHEDDCSICESLDRVQHTSGGFHEESFLSKDYPFIVLDAMDKWQVMNTDKFWFDNITELYSSDPYKDVKPCELTTNLKVPYNDLQKFIENIHDDSIHNWFGHWENCDHKAAKILRLFYQRPYFVPSTVDLSESNWVLLSSNYNAKSFLQLDFHTELLCLVQLRGWNRIRIVPREPCDDYCPDLTDNLLEGQILVLKSWLWNLQYIPGDNTDNFAIAIGGDFT